MDKNWVPIQELANELYCSTRFIHSCKTNGLFIAGEHFYKVGNHSQGKLIFNIDLCRKALLDQTRKESEDNEIVLKETYKNA